MGIPAPTARRPGRQPASPCRSSLSILRTEGGHTTETWAGGPSRLLVGWGGSLLSPPQETLVTPGQSHRHHSGRRGGFCGASGPVSRSGRQARHPHGARCPPQGPRDTREPTKVKSGPGHFLFVTAIYSKAVAEPEGEGAVVCPGPAPTAPADGSELSLPVTRCFTKYHTLQRH